MKFKIYERNIDVAPFMKLIRDNEKDWDNINNIGMQGKTDVTGCIPLTIGIKYDPSEDIDDVENQVNTPFYKTYEPLVQAIRERGFANHNRMGIFRLNPEQQNGMHTETGAYYENKNRWHLSLSGFYVLNVDGTYYDIVPGMFFWFDNSLPHSAVNVGKNVRYSLVFDADKSIEYKKQ